MTCICFTVQSRLRHLVCCPLLARVDDVLVQGLALDPDQILEVVHRIQRDPVLQ